MKGRNLSKEYAIKSLLRKGCIFYDNFILIPDKKRIGNKTWGVIDYVKKMYKVKVAIINKKGEMKKIFKEGFTSMRMG